MRRAAAEYGVSPRTVKRWADHYREELGGGAGSSSSGNPGVVSRSPGWRENGGMTSTAHNGRAAVDAGRTPNEASPRSGLPGPRERGAFGGVAAPGPGPGAPP
ncbi:hypothetical protein EBN88_26140, partial [Streptomyces triticirhizae]